VDVPDSKVTLQGHHHLDVLHRHRLISRLLQPACLHVAFCRIRMQVLKTEVAYWAVNQQDLPLHKQSFPTFWAFPDNPSIHFYGLRAHEHTGLCKV